MQRERLARAAVVRRARSTLWCEITTGTPTSRPMRKVSSSESSTSLGLVAHVRAVEPAELAQRAADLDHLFGRRSGRRLVVEAGRDADRAGAERLARQLAHAPDLRRAGGPLDVVHRDHAQRRVPDEQRAVGRRGFVRAAPRRRRAKVGKRNQPPSSSSRSSGGVTGFAHARRAQAPARCRSCRRRPWSRPGSPWAPCPAPTASAGRRACARR